MVENISRFGGIAGLILAGALASSTGACFEEEIPPPHYMSMYREADGVRTDREREEFSSTLIENYGEKVNYANIEPIVLALNDYFVHLRNSSEEGSLFRKLPSILRITRVYIADSFEEYEEVAGRIDPDFVGATAFYYNNFIYFSSGVRLGNSLYILGHESVHALEDFLDIKIGENLSEAMGSVFMPLDFFVYEPEAGARSFSIFGFLHNTEEGLLNYNSPSHFFSKIHALYHFAIEETSWENAVETIVKENETERSSHLGQIRLAESRGNLRNLYLHLVRTILDSDVFAGELSRRFSEEEIDWIWEFLHVNTFYDPEHPEQFCTFPLPEAAAPWQEDFLKVRSLLRSNPEVCPQVEE